MSVNRKNIKVDESYVSFKNIDCFENACAVIDNLLRLLEKVEDKNPYWEKFISKIPKAYHTRNPKDDPAETLLYLACSNAAIIGEFIDDSDDDEAIHALEKCESECC